MLGESHALNSSTCLGKRMQERAFFSVMSGETWGDRGRQESDEHHSPSSLEEAPAAEEDDPSAVCVSGGAQLYLSNIPLWPPPILHSPHRVHLAGGSPIPQQEKLHTTPVTGSVQQKWLTCPLLPGLREPHKKAKKSETVKKALEGTLGRVR